MFRTFCRLAREHVLLVLAFVSVAGLDAQPLSASSPQASRAGSVTGTVNPAARAAQPAAKPAPSLSPAARSAIFDRILAPKSAAVAGAAAKTTKEKDRLDAATAYDRGLVFAQQGAWTEAEKELRTAEKKDDDNVEHVFSVAYAYLKLHRPDEAIKRYEKVYKRDPRSQRALVGLAAAYEDRQNYREAVRMWLRYSKTDLVATEKQEASALLASARESFAQYYEIAENPGGGAANALNAEQEQQLGQMAAREFAQSGVEPFRDTTVNRYMERLCQTLVSKAKNFPTNYQVFVLDTADVNAFTIPGFVFVNRGLISAVDNEAELAGVIAHEIGHAVSHHSAKRLTKHVQDEQQAKELQGSNNRFLRWLGSMSASGAGFGQLSFSREAEEQADRLAVHITFDSGIDPRGFASFFQKLESISPSSRNSWDLMRRTHPFSIDRLNTINAYIELLPERRTRTSSPEFTQMRAHLAKLPPPSDATGQVTSGIEPPRSPAPANRPPVKDARRPAGGGTATQPFTMDHVPFAGEIPAGWGGRKTPSGTIVFEGPEGTEAYEVSVEFGFEPKRSGVTIDTVARSVQDALARKPNPKFLPTESQQADDGTPVRLIRGRWATQGNSGQTVTLKHLTVVLDYPSHYVLVSYYTPEPIFDKYQDACMLILKSIRYTGR